MYIYSIYECINILNIYIYIYIYIYCYIYIEMYIVVKGRNGGLTWDTGLVSGTSVASSQHPLIIYAY